MTVVALHRPIFNTMPASGFAVISFCHCRFCKRRVSGAYRTVFYYRFRSVSSENFIYGQALKGFLNRFRKRLKGNPISPDQVESLNRCEKNHWRSYPMKIQKPIRLLHLTNYILTVYCSKEFQFFRQDH